MSHTLNTNGIESSDSIQATSNKHQASGLDSRSSLGYYRTNGEVQHRSRFVGRIHITNRRHAHLVRSSMRAARKYPGVRPIKDLCQAVALQGIGIQARLPVSRLKQQASSYKPQASSVRITDLSPKLQASSLKPQATSCLICVP